MKWIKIKESNCPVVRNNVTDLELLKEVVNTLRIPAPYKFWHIGLKYFT
jgi:hypothetical protein